MTAFDDLLELQDEDTRIDQLRHRLATLPERATLDEHLHLVLEHDAVTGEVRSKREQLARDQRRIEDEVATVDEKAKGVDATLYSGSVRSPRELQALQEDLDSLRRRQRELEDRVLEVMEEVEPLDEELERRAEERAALERRSAELKDVLFEVIAVVEAELATVEATRASTAAEVPDAVVIEYERLRRELNGVAVARLVGSNCGGCHLTLSAVERDRIKHLPADAIVHCEECGRLLVRS